MSQNKTVSTEDVTAAIKHLSAQKTGGQHDNLNYVNGMLDLGAYLVPNSGTLSLDAGDYRDAVYGSPVAVKQLSPAQVTTTLVITRLGSVSLATADTVIVKVDDDAYIITSGLTPVAASVTVAGIVAASETGALTEITVLAGATVLATWTGSVTLT